jgi:hypothetical protein
LSPLSAEMTASDGATYQMGRRLANVAEGPFRRGAFTEGALWRIAPKTRRISVLE